QSVVSRRGADAVCAAELPARGSNRVKIPLQKLKMRLTALLPGVTLLSAPCRRAVRRRRDQRRFGIWPAAPRREFGANPSGLVLSGGIPGSGHTIARCV